MNVIHREYICQTKVSITSLRPMTQRGERAGRLTRHSVGSIRKLLRRVSDVSIFQAQLLSGGLLAR